MKRSNVVILLLAGGLVLAAAYCLYQQYPLSGWGGYNGYHGGRGMSMHLGMGLVMPLFWVLVIAWVFSIFGRKQSDTHLREPDALEILRQRYARGEIDKAEFRAMSTELESS